MRVAFIGCVQSSRAFLTRVLALPEVEVVAVVTREAAAFNADFAPLRPLADEAGIPCFLARSGDQAELARWLRRFAPDVTYCFGWSWLLRPEVLVVPRLGTIGFHPAALPANRGRHPLIWALALGLSKTASTFFFLDEGADSGDILSQEPIPILDEDDAGTLYAKVTAVALRQIETFTPQLAAGTFSRRPQDHSRATSWRKRGRADGQVDWRMSARSIHNLVRALTRPYVGAHCLYRGADVKLWRTALREGAPLNAEPGKVLARDGGRIVVKCGEGAVELVEHELPDLPPPGSYL
jgi:methionyl-tRNA formyltransferase